MSENWRENANLPVYIGIAVGIGTAIAFFLYKQKSAQIKQYATVPMYHLRARGPEYPLSTTVKKFLVPDDMIPWTVEFPTYKPVDYTDPTVKALPIWADKDISDNGIKWNSLDGKVDRRSHMGPYSVVNRVPRNPVGRTGMCGRGLLGKWGPNHAADPIVTRWSRDADGSIRSDPTSGKPRLQFVAIERKDSGEWAIPGGMVDAGESVSVTLKKEFAEEAMNVLESSQSEKEAIQEVVDEFFTIGDEVYRGYVDDPRNTDNAWMETVAVNFHDDSGEGVGKFKLHAGDDACKVQWIDIDRNLKLYASHSHFIQKVAELRHCHW